ncbi:hypothetical protein KR222_000220 [Zaprionus bogoriensis]|nr:hypothetical protein KR222_000220 [Zaprionus bogoriensis]
MSCGGFKINARRCQRSQSSFSASRSWSFAAINEQHLAILPNSQTCVCFECRTSYQKLPPARTEPELINMLKYLCIAAAVMQSICLIQAEAPAYIKQCARDDPKLVDCFIGALEHLRPYLANGIPEIELPPVEPFKMDSLSLQLTEGPQGYKITLKNMEAFGASNYQVQSLKLGVNGGEPFKARIIMPKLKIEAKYTSSGVLLIIPASGGGDFHAVFEGVTADLTGKTSLRGNYLHVDSLSLVLDVKKVNMSISRAFNNNRILLEATNLFLRDNSQVVLEAMQAQLQKKLATEFGKLANQLLKNVPVEQFYSN